MRLVIVCLGLVAACATSGSVDEDVESEVGEHRLTWSRDGVCEPTLADDGQSVLLACRKPTDLIEVIDVATGTSRWSYVLGQHGSSVAYTHGDRVYVWEPRDDFRVWLVTFALADGTRLSDVRTDQQLPVHVAWDAAGNRYDASLGYEFSTSHTQFIHVISYDAAGVRRWGNSIFSQTTQGRVRLHPSSDGIVYVVAHEVFAALSAAGANLWEARVGAPRSVFLASDGSPIVETGIHSYYFPTTAPVDASFVKPRVTLPDGRVTREVVINGARAFVVVRRDRYDVRGLDGQLLYSIAASSALAPDGIAGPEFGQLATAGSTGTLVQTPTGIALLKHGAQQPAWTRTRFFLPVATGTKGFIGLCVRPETRTVDTPLGPVDDTATFCALSEGARSWWRVTVPYDNYGIAERFPGSVPPSRWLGDTATWVEAPAVKTWIVSSTAGTYAIRGD